MILMLRRILACCAAWLVTHGASAQTPTTVHMRNVNFHVGDGIVLGIRTLSGRLVPTHPGPVVFDDVRSFTLNIVNAEVGITDDNLTRLLNTHVFAYPGAPLKHLHVTVKDGMVRQTGTLHKLVDISFDITSTVDLTTNGLIRLHPKKMKIFGVNGKGLMRLLNISLEKMLDLSKATGVTVHGNDLYLDPVRILPPPTMRGHIATVRVEGNQLVQVFTSTEVLAPPALPDRSARNYMFYRGGMLRFGRLTMSDAELEIIDRAPQNPFDFDLGHYMRQLIAGYSRTLPDGGLLVVMPDASGS